MKSSEAVSTASQSKSEESTNHVASMLADFSIENMPSEERMSDATLPSNSRPQCKGDIVLPPEITKELHDAKNNIFYRQYRSEEDLKQVMRLITKDLSEPYSIYTYRYFLNLWPELCFLAIEEDTKEIVGCIVCKRESAGESYRRGYIAMLAVESSHRRKGIGSLLVKLSIQQMILSNCQEVALEAEVTNLSALCLYENLGFIRERHLFRYYLNGNDAYYLKLYLHC